MNKLEKIISSIGIWRNRQSDMGDVCSIAIAYLIGN